MMGYIICGMMIFSLVFSMLNGTAEKVCESALNSADTVIGLSLTICAVMAFWGGIMNIAHKSGLTGKIAALLSPIVKLLFKGVRKGSKAYNAICMNITANMLGLGNAATPLGIEALKELDSSNDDKKRNTSMLVVINTASIQLIPTTVAAIRLKHGSAHPYEIIPAVLFTSLVSVLAGCVMTNIMYSRKKRNDR